MTDTIDNPPAFPRTAYPGSENLNTPYAHHEQDGMTLLDWFAGHSPVRIADAEHSLAKSGHPEVSHADIFKRLAQMRYAYADAMLAERARRKP